MKLLGRKQSITNADWLNASENIEATLSKPEIDRLADETSYRILERIKGKRVAYAWSGGKDSIVLGHLCEAVGISDCMIGLCDLEYPAFMAWINEHKPAGLEIINTHHDMEWLVQHPAMLFPRNSTVAAQWFSIIQHTAQRRYYKAHDLDMLLLGRRKVDGNYVGHNDNIYTDGKGVTRYSPLADWRHEDILAYIHYNQLPLPPIYTWQNGYKCGTHPWPARQWTQSVNDGWKEIYDIDPTIVTEAADYLESAKLFLQGVMI